VHHSLGVDRIGRERAADHRHRPAGGADRPSALEEALRPGQLPEPCLNTTEHDEPCSRAAGEAADLDPAAGNLHRLRRHRRAILTRYHRLVAEIDRSTVEHVARLARLGLTDDEIDRMQSQLSRILDAIEVLQTVDTSRIDPTAQVIELENVMRDDVVHPGLPREAALANAPERSDAFLRVPTVLEEGR
jgi:aspartyl-tRNA(Asn)/glutamyl-tRNA(Gln) amidotransferase subunit C